MATRKPSIQREALQLVFWQLIVTMALALIVLLIEGLSKGMSTFLGGGAYILPQFLFTWRVFSYANALKAQQFVVAFFFGEFLKLLLSAIFFVLIVKFLPVMPAFVMIGYVFAIVSFWFVCGWHFSRNRLPKSRISS